MDDFFTAGFDEDRVADPFGDQNDFLFGNDDITTGDIDETASRLDGVPESDTNAGSSSMLQGIPADVLSLEEATYPFPVKPGGVPPYISPSLLRYFFPNLSSFSRPVVVNVISQANLNVGIDLRDLSCAVRTAEYMPDSRIPTVTLRLQMPAAVVIVRSSGALTIIGARSVSESRQAAELAARILRKALNLSLSTFQFRVRSISARFNACSPVRLDALGQHVFQRNKSAGGVSRVLCHYEPERFNGCTIRMVGQSSFSSSSRIQSSKKAEGASTHGFPSQDDMDVGRKRDRDETAAEELKRQRNRWCVSCVVYVTGKMTFLGARSPEELEFAFNAAVPIVAQYLGRASQMVDERHDDAESHTGTRTARVLAPPSRENVEAVIQFLREQWTRHQRALAATGNDMDGADWEEDEEAEEMFGPLGEGRGMMDGGHAFSGDGGDEDDEDLDDYEDEMDDGMGGEY